MQINQLKRIIRKSQKRHLCNHCGEYIEIEERYVWIGMGGTGFTKFKLHQGCNLELPTDLDELESKIFKNEQQWKELEEQYSS